MIIVWRRQAERDLQQIFDFILDHDPSAAHRICERIERRVAQLRDHPRMGRPGRVAGTPELVVAARPTLWRIGKPACRSTSWRVLHASRRWPASLG